jgi:RNA polymerase sigma factor (sigma-70 family)
MRVDNPAVDPQELLTHAAWLHRLAARLVEASAVEDLLQDAYVVALKSPPRVVHSPRPWLAEVLRNLVRNGKRSSARLSARARLVADAATALPTAEQLLTQHEARRLVAELVSKLEEPFRSTVLLCYGEGLTPSEVARRQGVPAGTVRWRLKRGLDDLRAALDQRYGNDRRAWCLALAPLAAAAVPVAASFPVVGAIKLGAGVAAAAALGLWLGTWPASRPAAGARSGEAAAPASRAGNPGRGPRRFAAAGFVQPGPGAAPQTELSAAAPDGLARAGKPPSEAIQNLMQAGNAPTKGDSKAPVTIVMFTDFQCPFSARGQELMTQLLAAYPGQIRLVARNLPLPFHEHAKLAGEAALAAHEQGKFWQMHERLFANQKALDPPALEEHARPSGSMSQDSAGRSMTSVSGGRWRKTCAWPRRPGSTGHRPF